uniref:Alcohol dehydrogenase class III n=1 Tax=Ralstonia solanacearum TaxID=305 RepID=A0A0S4U165_RALSL
MPYRLQETNTALDNLRAVRIACAAVLGIAPEER